MKVVRVFAPATIGNIGPGFDVLGMAITGLGDTVEAKKIKGREVVISEITGRLKYIRIFLAPAWEAARPVR